MGSRLVFEIEPDNIDSVVGFGLKTWYIDLSRIPIHRTVSWRVCQLKHPKSSYRNKTRTESPVILPGPPPVSNYMVTLINFYFINTVAPAFC